MTDRTPPAPPRRSISPFPPHDPLTSPHAAPAPVPTSSPSPSDSVGLVIDAIDKLIEARVRHDSAAAELRPTILRSVDRARSNLEIVLRQLFAQGGPRRSSSTRMAAVRVDERRETGDDWRDRGAGTTIAGPFPLHDPAHDEDDE